MILRLYLMKCCTLAETRCGRCRLGGFFFYSLAYHIDSKKIAQELLELTFTSYQELISDEFAQIERRLASELVQSGVDSIKPEEYR